VSASTHVHEGRAGMGTWTCGLKQVFFLQLDRLLYVVLLTTCLSGELDSDGNEHAGSRPSISMKCPTSGHTWSIMRCCKIKETVSPLRQCTMLNAMRSVPAPAASNPLAHVSRITYLPIFSSSLLWIELPRCRIQSTTSRAACIWCWLPLCGRLWEVASLHVLCTTSRLTASTTATTRNACTAI
jgi:hypothetical protein